MAQKTVRCSSCNATKKVPADEEPDWTESGYFGFCEKCHCKGYRAYTEICRVCEREYVGTEGFGGVCSRGCSDKEVEERHEQGRIQQQEERGRAEDKAKEIKEGLAGGGIVCPVCKKPWEHIDYVFGGYARSGAGNKMCSTCRQMAFDLKQKRRF